MQSIEYKILSHVPVGLNSIDNISSTNSGLYWESSGDSATIDFEFPECVITEFLLSTESSVNFHFIGGNCSGNESTLIENSLNISGGKKQQVYSISNKSLSSKGKLQISTQHGGKLKIYSVIIKTHRENHSENKAKPTVNSMKPVNFYKPTNGNTPKTTLKQSTLFGTLTTASQKSEKKVSQVIDTPEFVEDQRKLFENIQNNRQRTLRSYASKQKVPTSSYQNLLAPSAAKAHVMCCKDEEPLKKCIEEMCEVLGICYFNDLEEGVTHMIYEGTDGEIIDLARQLEVIVITKQWLIDCISYREYICPDLYKRVE